MSVELRMRSGLRRRALARRAQACGAIIALASAGACSGTPPETRAYLLCERSAPVAVPAHDLPALRVKPLVARGFLDAKSIAWRQGDVLAGAYRYHDWSEPPAEMVTRALILALRDGGRFSAVDGVVPRAIAPLTLGGELIGLHEVAEADGSKPRGVAELEVTLEAEAGAGVPARHWTLRASKSVEAADDSIDAVVRAVSEAASQAVADLARDVANAAAAAGR